MGKNGNQTKNQASKIASGGNILNSGWAGGVLRTLVSVFVIAIVFGVFLDATVVTGGTLQQTQPYTVTQTTVVNSVNAGHFASANTANSLLITYSGSFTNISTTNPLTVTLVGNSMTAFGTNTANPTVGNYQTQTYIVTNANAILSNTAGNFYSIKLVNLSVANGAYYVGTLTATVTQAYNAVANGDVTNTYLTNTIVAQGSLTSAAQTVAGTSPFSLFESLVGYLVTLANFVGIIILLVIIMIVILVIYSLFSPIEGTAGVGVGGGI